MKRIEVIEKQNSDTSSIVMSADDYREKPFDLQKVYARIQVLRGYIIEIK